MILRLLPPERRQAKAYRAMMKRVRQRERRAASYPPPALALRPYRGREILPEHKQAVAHLPCIATLIRHGLIVGGVHVAHIRFSRYAAGSINPGLQRKPDDRWILPLAPHEHRLQHSIGEALYWAELGVDPHALAAELFDLSPDVNAMTLVLVERARKECLRAPSTY